MEMDHRPGLVIGALQEPETALPVDLVRSQVVALDLVVLAHDLLPPPVDAHHPAARDGGNVVEALSPDKGNGILPLAANADRLEVEARHACMPRSQRNCRSARMFPGSIRSTCRKGESP